MWFYIGERTDGLVSINFSEQIFPIMSELEPMMPSIEDCASFYIHTSSKACQGGTTFKSEKIETCEWRYGFNIMMTYFCGSSLRDLNPKSGMISCVELFNVSDENLSDICNIL